MAVNVLMPLLIPLGEQITNVTRLTGTGNLFFTQNVYEVYVPENTAPVLLLTLHAETNSTLLTVHYTLLGNEDGHLRHPEFSLDGYSGHLTLTQPLDFEEKEQHELIVGARAGAETAFGRVRVNVRDENDHAPFFPLPLYETQITEEDDRHLPKTMLEVAAEDLDSADRESLCYSLSGDGVTNSSLTSKFAIGTSSGKVHLLKPLDRDPPNGKQQWRLKVHVSDGVNKASTEVQVNLKDINDNAPFFPSSVINATVPENGKEGETVLVVTARDHDDTSEGSNASLVYSIEKNVIDEHTGRPIFAIEPNSGRVTTAMCCLDREKTQSYAIQVVATDGGGLKDKQKRLLSSWKLLEYTPDPLLEVIDEERERKFESRRALEVHWVQRRRRQGTLRITS